MYIFLDESGDLGFNFEKESSAHFVITLLTCSNHETLLGFQSAVKYTIKRKLKSKPNKPNELKSTQTLLSVKKYFLEKLLKQQKQDWCIYSIIVDKKHLLKKINLIPEQHRLYNLLSKVVLQQVEFNSNENKSVHLIVDRSKGKKQRNIFNQYLQTNIESVLDIGTKFRIDHELSHNSAGLQAVDLFCSGFSRKYSYNDTEWYDMFSNKICKEIIFDIDNHK